MHKLSRATDLVDKITFGNATGEGGRNSIHSGMLFATCRSLKLCFLFFFLQAITKHVLLLMRLGDGWDLQEGSAIPQLSIGMSHRYLKVCGRDCNIMLLRPLRNSATMQFRWVACHFSVNIIQLHTFQCRHKRYLLARMYQSIFQVPIDSSSIVLLLYLGGFKSH